MATVVKDFKIKSGLIVEGASATVNNFAVLTKSSADQSYITNLVGGSGSSANTADTLVLRDENGDFAAGTITADLVGDVTGNADTASTLATARTISISGDATGSVSFDGSQDATIAITLDGSFATDTEVSAAQTAAESFATSAANTAETNANDYTDDRETAITTAYEAYADQAEVDAKAYTDTRETAITTAYQSYADTAEADAISTASSDATSKANTAESNANDYTDSLIGDATVDGTGGNTITDRIASAVAALVDSAPAALDTLNELAEALGDDANFVTTITTSIGEKVAKSGDTMTGDLTLAQDPTLGLHAATKQYVDGEISTLETSLQTYADTAESDAITSANSYTDGRETAITTAYESYADQAEADAISTAAADATSKANTAESNANTYTDGQITTVNGTINALTTDDIAEGTNEYYTAEKAQDDVAAAIAAGTHANITITYDDNAGSISFVAENGVADSTTDDLTEGSTRLYFTDARAVSALEAVVPNFTEVDINSVATQVAATQTVATASQVVGYSFDSGTYRSAKFIVKLQTGTHTEVSEVLLTLDSSDNISITEFAVVGTNGSLSTITAGMNGTDVELLVTTAENSSDVTVMGTLLV
jgi:hypothetical protein